MQSCIVCTVYIAMLGCQPIPHPSSVNIKIPNILLQTLFFLFFISTVYCILITIRRFPPGRKVPTDPECFNNAMSFTSPEKVIDKRNKSPFLPNKSPVTMNKKKLAKWIILVLAAAWLPLHADPHKWFTFVHYEDLIPKDTPTDQRLEALKIAAHRVFRGGLRDTYPMRYDNNMAWSFYRWLVNDDIPTPPGPPGVYLYYDRRSFQRWEPGQTGVLFSVSPDERSFPLSQTLFTLSEALPAGDHDSIARTLGALRTDFVGERYRVAGVPLSTDTTPVETIIRGENIATAYIYIDGTQRYMQHRDPQGDGEFVPAARTNNAGYPFVSPPAPPEQSAYNITVAPPGTDHLASLAGCSHWSNRTTRSTTFDRTGQGDGSCISEKITLDEFLRRHARHRGAFMPAIQLLQ
ncbi:hypothetical protein ISS98_12930 [Dyella flagellata]